MSWDVPSPQFTVIPVTVVELVTAKVRLTDVPVLTGLGVGVLTITVGGVIGVWTVTDPVA
jgi:hypothetical protein